MTAHYSNPNVVTDSDTSYVSIHPYRWIVDKNGNKIGVGEGSEGHGCCRDGMDRWCNGAGEFEKANQNGFDYHLDLDWQIDGQSQKTFNETFHCRWVGKQTFKKNGFTITITVNLK